MESQPEKCRDCPVIEWVNQNIEDATSDDMAAALTDYRDSLLQECQTGPVVINTEQRWPLRGIVTVIRCSTPRAAYIDKKFTEKPYPKK